MSAIDQLNDQQQRFVMNIAAGVSGTRAYSRAGYGASTRSAANGASRMLRRPEIARAIGEIRREQRALSLLTWEHKIRIIEQIIDDPTASPSARLSAIKMHNSMLGDYIPLPPEQPQEPEPESELESTSTIPHPASCAAAVRVAPAANSTSPATSSGAKEEGHSCPSSSHGAFPSPTKHPSHQSNLSRSSSPQPAELPSESSVPEPSRASGAPQPAACPP